jgi:hypothetical protein
MERLAAVGDHPVAPSARAMPAHGDTFHLVRSDCASRYLPHDNETWSTVSH